jgi:hypothetical protein
VRGRGETDRRSREINIHEERVRLRLTTRERENGWERGGGIIGKLGKKGKREKERVGREIEMEWV